MVAAIGQPVQPSGGGEELRDYRLRRLGTDHIDIYRPSRLDPRVPVEDAVGAIAELVQAGYVRHIGLSDEVGARTRTRLAESLASAGVQLTEDDLALIEKAIPADAAAGSRYAETMLHSLDSER